MEVNNFVLLNNNNKTVFVFEVPSHEDLWGTEGKVSRILDVDATRR
jgi:hypothetical protein